METPTLEQFEEVCSSQNQMNIAEILQVLDSPISKL